MRLQCTQQEGHIRIKIKCRDDVYKFQRQVFALPFLPADHTLDAFYMLKEKATTEQLQNLMTCIEDNWFHSTVWSVAAWSIFGKSIRTNNDVEGWHNRVNTHAGKSNLQIYLLLQLMYDSTTTETHQ